MIVDPYLRRFTALDFLDFFGDTIRARIITKYNKFLLSRESPLFIDIGECLEEILITISC